MPCNQQRNNFTIYLAHAHTEEYELIIAVACAFMKTELKMTLDDVVCSLHSLVHWWNHGAAVTIDGNVHCLDLFSGAVSVDLVYQSTEPFTDNVVLIYRSKRNICH